MTTANPVPPAPSPAIEHLPRRENPVLRGIALWHLLSLDAPSVAMLWTWFIARVNHISLPANAVLAMGIAVWTLYAADRLLDTRALSGANLPTAPVILSEVPRNASPSRTKSKDPGTFNLTRTTRSFLPATPMQRSYPDRDIHPSDLEPRHHFHRHHQNAFRLAILVASLVLAALLPDLAPQSIRLYLALATLLFGYFVVIHTRSETNQPKTQRLPKELAVGVFFSAATFIPTVARNPALRLDLMPGAVLFAVLCSLNCLFIYIWEHPATSPLAHPATRLALRLLPHLAIAAAITGLLLSLANRSLPWRISLACAIAALLLLLLHKNSYRLSPTTLRAAADLCLLTPLLLLHS